MFLWLPLWFMNMGQYILNQRCKNKRTFSVTGNRRSTAHTGLGTMLRSSGSNPYTSPNCQVGFIPKQLTNYTKFESKYVCMQRHKAALTIYGKQLLPMHAHTLNFSWKTAESSLKNKKLWVTIHFTGP